ncbi:MAG: GerMN domain-containing protein [Acidimicrobiia bacterium]|nr:GerMN domain-containing protein [Acidimicrobiia bacterium]
MSTRRLGILLIVVALVAAACGESNGSADPTSTTAPSTTTTTTAPATTTTTTPPPTTTTVPAPDQYVSAYFLVDEVTGEGGPFIRPVTRTIEPTTAVGRAAIAALIDGPTAAEQAGTPAISGGLPDGTQLLGLTVAAGVARVDLSAEIENVGGTFGEMAVLAQLVFTLTQFPTVDEVVLLIDGVQVEFYGSHGMEVTPSLTRDSFLGAGLVADILIDSPAWFAQTESPLVVRGIARVFEAAAEWALYDNDGLPLAEGFTMASTGGPDWGTFQFAIPYTVDTPQLGALMMWEESAKDGSQLHLVEHPVWLTP